MNDPVVIVSAVRTPMGGFQGSLASMSANALGSCAIRAAVERAGITGEDVQEVFMGNVLQAGQGQAPARQASLGAGLPLGVGCTTINKICGSGMKSVMLANDLILAGVNDVVVAGGMESMSNSPDLLPRARSGYRMGHGQVVDQMFLDGLEDAYDKGRLMGTFAEDCVDKYGFTREQQDEFAISSLERARKAVEDGSFQSEIAPVTVQTRQVETLVESDEQPFNANIEKIPTLRPAFRKEGTVTAANSSSISDGAASLVVMRRSEAEKRGLTPKAVILGHSTHAQEPGWFTTAPVGAMNKLFAKLDMSGPDFDLYEINEAFSGSTVAVLNELQLDPSKVNVNGGSVALGHPIGASGCRVLVTLLHEMIRQDKKAGLASLCLGGGEAVAMVVKR